MRRSYGSYCNECVVQPSEIYQKIYVSEFYAAYYSDYFVVQKYEDLPDFE